MNRSFREIERFLLQVRQPSLFSYLSLSPAADADTIQRTLQARRVWAQAQQANPRYREEAIWFIRNRRLIHAALLENRAAYLHSLARAQQLRALNHVQHFITVMGINEDTLPTIRAYGQRAGLSDLLIDRLIARHAPEHGYSSAEVA